MTAQPTTKNYIARDFGWEWPMVALFTNEQDFRRELKRLNVSGNLEFVPNNKDARVHYLERDKKLICLVCVTAPKGVSALEMYGLLVHEAVHIFQLACENCGETKPGDEFEAYSIQSIAQRLMAEYDRQAKHHHRKAAKQP